MGQVHFKLATGGVARLSLSMPRGLIRLLLIMLGLALLSGPLAADDGWWRRQEARDLDGALIPATGRWIVLVFISPECPVANASVPTLNALEKEFGPRGFTLVGIYSDPLLSLPLLRRHAEEYRLGFPVSDDRSQRLVRSVGATYTPEVFVFTADGTRLYRGRIDDRVGDFGATRPSAVRQDLREVLLALVGGKSGPFPDCAGFGCAIPEAVKP